MSALSSERMLKLMAYADGELEGRERAEVELWLASDVDASRFANDIALLGELTREGHAGSSEGNAIAAFDIADAVVAAAQVDGARAGSPSAALASASRPSSLDEARARRARNLRVGGMVAAALALAASFLVMTRTPKEAPLARGAPIAPAAASAEPGVDVDLVETAGDTVRVFYLSSESSPTTSVVVWVDETGGK